MIGGNKRLFFGYFCPNFNGTVMVMQVFSTTQSIFIKSQSLDTTLRLRFCESIGLSWNKARLIDSSLKNMIFNSVCVYHVDIVT